MIDLTVPPLPIPRYEGICSLEPTTKIPLEKCTKEHAFAYQRLYHKLRNRSESSPDLLHLICNSTRIFNYLGDKRQVSDNFSSLIRDYHATFPESRFAKEIFDLLPYLKEEEAIAWLKEHPKQLLKTHSNALSKYMIGHEKAMIYYDLIEPFLGPESLVRIGSKSRFSELKDLYPYEAQEEICCKILSRLINWDLQAIKWLLQPLKVKWGSVALAERVNQLFYLSENFFHYSDEIRVQFILSYLKSIGYMDTQERFAFAVNGYMSGARFESIEQGLKTTRVLNRVLNEEQMVDWLAFFEMTRGQVGIPLCQYVLRTQMASQKVIRAALSALERIGPYVHPMYANCVRLCTFSNNQGVEAQACKTLWALNPDPNCSWDRNILLEHLPHSISVLGNYNFDSNEDRRRIDQLIALSHSEDLNLRVECAQTLSRIPDKKALLRALEIAQSRDWALFDPYFKQYKQDLAGHHTLIMTRPQFEDSRTMMILRIQQQLLKIEPPPEGVFEQEESYEHLDRFEKRCKIKEECRFTPTPLFLPEGPGRYLFRGLCERKGDDLLPIAIRDLFMRGCGPSDLIGFGADYDQGTWSKTGQIFTSIDKSSVERHYVEDEGMLLVIRSSYYNRSYIRGRARMEKEGALNPVFYDGVPLSEIEAIYLPKSYQEDVELLASKELSDDEVYEELATTAFRHREFLPILRKNIRGLLPRIGYRDGGDAWYNPIKEREVIEESVRQRIARDWLVTQYPPGFFDPQDRKLSHLSDDEFLAHVDDLYPLFLNDEEIAFLRRTDLEEVKASLRNLDTSSISPSRLRRYKRLQVLFSPFGPEKAQEIIARCRPLYNIREGEEHMVLTPTP
ncbi:MAG: hypothetical protein JSS61_05560 [Verrucomicrobia bacterium]|nr:hypothetical protein [Verrucomicrobiota bacterium]